MTNLQLVDLHDVEAYWKNRHLVDEPQMTYYLRWLQRFLVGPGSDARLSALDAQRVFGEQLERRGDIPEWQIRQALRAVELYQKHYLQYRAETSQSTTAAEIPAGPPAPPTTLEAAMAEVQRLTRIRHYAYGRGFP